MLNPLLFSFVLVFDNEVIQQVLDFFAKKLSLLDFLIIGLGSFLICYQLLKRFTTSSKRFYLRAKEDPLYLNEAEVKLTYISNLIELLPVMGILGTVWGLMQALTIISSLEMPSIKDIATHIAPALSTTFFGLLFAVINLFFFNFLQAYWTELIAWCRYNLPATSSNETTQLAEKEEEKENKEKKEVTENAKT